ncbi:MAG: tRNA modification GTPase [Thermoguttaceae bacterium]
MSYCLDETIAAIASPPGPAARGILRLTGPEVAGCIARVFRPEPPRDLGAIRLPTGLTGWLDLAEVFSPIPSELLFWPTGRSYTGQPVAEIHTLGSPPLLAAALEALCAAGARPAQPGEFTLRAFLAGRVDLTQAEAVLGVIDAVDARQLEVALGQLAGGLANPLRRLRSELLDLLAHLEAGFDFADEQIEFITTEQLDRQLQAAAQTVGRLLGQMASRRETANLVRVVLVGWPNTGKSSLLNALLGRTGALVSELPGTTRDYLTAELDLDGQLRCLLVDTAGIEPDGAGLADPLRRSAQQAAAEQASLAQVRLLCLECTRPLNAWEVAELAREAPERIVVLTKIDLPRRIELACPAVATSSLTGEGIGALRQRIAAAVLAAQGSEGDMVAGTAARCRESLRLAAECLQRAREVLPAGQELVAAELRVALEELGKVVGAVCAEDILDRIFSRFCVGK